LLGGEATSISAKSLYKPPAYALITGGFSIYLETIQNGTDYSGIVEGWAFWWADDEVSEYSSGL
jgi:hypothetical protein